MNNGTESPRRLKAVLYLTVIFSLLLSGWNIKLSILFSSYSADSNNFNPEPVKHSISNYSTSNHVLPPPSFQRFGFCNTTSRCQKLDMHHKFSFIHIAKNSGASWIHELGIVLPYKVPKDSPFPEAGARALYPHVREGYEYSKHWHFKEFPGANHLTCLRSPRHHMWSMFTFLKYGDWGKKVTKDTDFPRHNKNITVDFELWLDNYIYQDKKKNLGRSYKPTNFQANYLVGNFTDRPDFSEMPLPNLGQATEDYWDLDWVGLTEFFSESKCLLFYRLRRGWREKIPQAKKQQLDSYLENKCYCNGTDAANDKSTDVHRSHNNKGSRNTLRHLPTRILDKIDNLTSVDRPLYAVALKQFLKEIVWLESQMNQRILCDHTLARNEAELTYLGLNITGVYHELRRLSF